jgi:hypothetical protein
MFSSCFDRSDDEESESDESTGSGHDADTTWMPVNEESYDIDISITERQANLF